MNNILNNVLRFAMLATLAVLTMCVSVTFLRDQARHIEAEAKVACPIERLAKTMAERVACLEVDQKLIWMKMNESSEVSEN